MSRILKTAAALLGAAAAAEAAGSAYLYRRTMIRYNAKTERTMKMSGVDWEKYLPMMKERREWLMEQPREDVWITSHDGLKLHGTYFKGEEGSKAVICFHGYTSQGLNDYGSLSQYYLKRGYRVLLIDERAHGQSEGRHIGFGVMDRLDGKRWVEWMVEKAGEDVQILLHGNSMGGATVLMMSGLDLPPQVKGIISDCAFTSMKDVFTHVLHSMYHMEKDVFVPCWMTEEAYKNCASPKAKLIVKDAGHGESYYKDTEGYESAMDSFIGGIIK